MRGKPLDADCKKATRTSNEYGPEDKRIYCFGLFNMTKFEVLPKCKMCMAYVENAEPLGEGWEDKMK